MIVKLSLGEYPRVTEGEDLKRLDVIADSPDALGQGVGNLGLIDPDGEHVWLDIAALREASDPGNDPSWSGGFSDMIEYARTKNWLDPEGRAVRAHVEFAVGE